jgi:hypothetical protein
MAFALVQRLSHRLARGRSADVATPAPAGDDAYAAASGADESFLESRAAITQFLFLQDPPAPVDLCFVLGCPTPTNMQPAVDLFRDGLTPWIVVSGHGPTPQSVPESETFRDYAVERGVPADVIILESAATNTLENFTFSHPIIEQRFGWAGIRRVAIVAKPYHMRRAVMTARQQWPAHLRLLARPSYHPDDPPAETWWQTTSGRRFVLAELRAIGTYALEGHIGGF